MFISQLPPIHFFTVCWGKKNALWSNCNFNCEHEKIYTFAVKSQVLGPCFTPPGGDHYGR